MMLKVLVPTGMLLETRVSKVVAEAQNGSFALLPRHIDFVTALVPGLLAYTPADEGGAEEFMVVDEGVLLKVGSEVLVAVQNAIAGADLGALRPTIEEQFATREERERAARNALTSLEVGVMRRAIEVLGE